MENPQDKKGHKTTYTCPHTAKGKYRPSNLTHTVVKRQTFLILSLPQNGPLKYIQQPGKCLRLSHRVMCEAPADNNFCVFLASKKPSVKRRQQPRQMFLGTRHPPSPLSQYSNHPLYPGKLKPPGLIASCRTQMSQV